MSQSIRIDVVIMWQRTAKVLRYCSYKELAFMRKDQVDLQNKVAIIDDSKTPTGVAEVPLTEIALEAFCSQISLSGSRDWLFPNERNPLGYQIER